MNFLEQELPLEGTRIALVRKALMYMWGNGHGLLDNRINICILDTQQPREGLLLKT